jgi:hypothetical protein
MRIVFPNLRSRLFCLIAGHATAQADGFLGEDEKQLVMPFQSAIDDLQIKNPERKKTAEGLHRHLARMRALCESDRKFLASLDLQQVTAALLGTVVRGGELRVCTELGKGSTFTIILPVG